MRDMKIRVNDANRQEVKAALLTLGYERDGRMDDLAIYNATKHYIAYGNGLVMCTGGDDAENEKHFLNHANEEYVLYQGEFKPMSYFTQPKTPEQKPVASIPKLPLGLRPRHDVLRERNQEILEAIGRYVEAGKVIPREWLNELIQNNEEME